MMCNYSPMQYIYLRLMLLCILFNVCVLQDLYRIVYFFFGGGQSRNCIFTKKPIKSAKTHFI